MKNATAVQRYALSGPTKTRNTEGFISTLQLTVGATVQGTAAGFGSQATVAQGMLWIPRGNDLQLQLMRLS